MEISDQAYIGETDKRHVKRQYEGATLLLFIIAQLALIPLKPYFFPQNGDERLLLFIGYEFVVAFITLVTYFLLKKSPNIDENNDISNSHHRIIQGNRLSEAKPAPINHSSEATQPSLPHSEGKKDETSPCAQCQSILTAEIELMKERFRKELEEKEAKHIESEKELLQTIQALREESQHVLSAKERLEKEHVHLENKLSSLFSLSRQLSNDLKIQYELLDQERRKHAIEMRTILKRENVVGSQSTFADERRSISSSLTKDGKTNSLFNVPQGTSVEAALSCFLSACKDAVRKGEGEGWPSLEHTYLVRRKFYDSLLFLRAVRVGAASVHAATTEIVSVPALDDVKKDIAQYIDTNKNELMELTEDEPLFAKIQDREYVFFRCHEKNLEDIIVFGQR